jgi:hypothetical protein
MPSEEANQAKNAGTTVYSKGDYGLAIDHFTKAIELGAGDKEFLKVLFSNRSASYLNLKQNEKALADGNKCVELDSNWPKGYGRKGDALYALRRYGEAYNAYNGGLRIAPNDANLKEKSEKVMAAIRNDAASSSSASSSSTSNSTTSGGTINYYLRLTTLLAIFGYLLPLGSRINTIAYKLSAGSFAIDQLLGLFQRQGTIQFTQDYLTRILPDPAVPRIFLSVLLTFAFRPYLFAIAPILLVGLTHFTNDLFTVSFLRHLSTNYTIIYLILCIIVCSSKCTYIRRKIFTISCWLFSNFKSSECESIICTSFSYEM